MNGDAIATQRLLQPTGAMPTALTRELKALQPATSMFAMHLGVRGEAPALPPIVHLHASHGAGALELVLPSTMDAYAAPPGTFTVELMRLVPPEQMAGWFDDAAVSSFDTTPAR